MYVLLCLLKLRRRWIRPRRPYLSLVKFAATILYLKALSDGGLYFRKLESGRSPRSLPSR
jgi:hypothetical protein